MKNILHKSVDIICIMMEIVFAIISIPFKLIKACFDIAAVISR